MIDPIDHCAAELFDWLQVRMVESGVRPVVAERFEAASDGVKADLRGIVRLVLESREQLAA